MAARQAGRREAASGLESQHGGAAVAGRIGARGPRLRLRCGFGAFIDDGGGRIVHAAFGCGLSARMDTAHGRQWDKALITARWRTPSSGLCYESATGLDLR